MHGSIKHECIDDFVRARWLFMFDFSSFFLLFIISLNLERAFIMVSIICLRQGEPLPQALRQTKGVWLCPPSSIDRHVYGVSTVSGCMRRVYHSDPAFARKLPLIVDDRYLYSFYSLQSLCMYPKRLTIISEWYIESLRNWWALRRPSCRT